MSSLGDEDAEVVAWSAFGLGATCKGRETKVVRALSARAGSLLLAEAPSAAPKPAPKAGVALLSPLEAIAFAYGRCGGSEAEKGLKAWLRAEPPLAEQAALGLGVMAARAGRLDDGSLVGLLDVSSGAQPTPTGLQAFTRLTELSEPVRARLRDVVRTRLATPGVARSLAVRALANGGPEVATELGKIVTDGGFSPAERADAARALGRLGAPGKAALGAAVGALLRDAASTSTESLLSDRYGVLVTALAALEPPGFGAEKELGRLADLPVTDSVPLRRRQVALRCRAAELLAGGGSQSERLAGCDPDPNGREGRLAAITVLGRGSLKGARLHRFNELALADDAVVRQRALELLKSHGEAASAPERLATALASRTPGDVATAAEILASYPERASREGGQKAWDPGVLRALGTALDNWKQSPLVEVRSALISAAGALELLGAKPRLEAECKSENPALREAAAKALGLLGTPGRTCDVWTPGAAPVELSRLLRGKLTLQFQTDAGPLTIELDPALAPVAATRVAELARSGFYNGIVVHRVVHGFVVQLGDPGGDGYGGASRPALRSELSPAPFEPGSVGIALGGKDSGSSQFFVTLGRHPHLDGEYALIGRAGPGWERLAEGDIVQKVSTAGK